MADVVLSQEAWKLLQPMLQHVARHGLWTPPVKKPKQNNTLPPPAYFHNASGGKIPPYACLQVTGTEEIDGQNYLVVDQPADTDGTSGGYVFNGPEAVADNEEGKYQDAQVVRAYKDTGTVTGGEKWSPVVNQWYIAQDDAGPFICCGADDVDTGVLKVFTQGVGSSAGFYVFTLTGAISSGSGTGTIRNLNDDTEVATSQTIRDALGFHDGWQVGERGYCVYQDGSYHAIALGPYVTDLRITTANKYQRSVNGGATFADWASGEECD